MKRNERSRKGRRGSLRQQQRRAAVAVQVAVGMGTLLGVSALAVDVGMIYSTRAELQRTADSVALAAAMELADQSGEDALSRARETASSFATQNKVLNAAVGLATTDVVFGRAALNDAGKYDFTPTEEFPNAIRVRVRRSEGSPSGPVSLFFANVFGISSTDVGAQATAVLVPRDIVIVTDLSGSHTDDSELRNYKNTQINLYDVWDDLPNTTDLVPQTDGTGFTSGISIADHGDGTATVRVELTSDGLNDTSALSHVTFELPAAAQAMAASTASVSGANYSATTGTDPQTGVNGLKFDYDGGGALGEDGVVGTHTFEFAIETGYLTEMNVGTKAGQAVDTSVSYNLAPGPTFGEMKMYGEYDVDAAYSPTSDAGLTRLPYNTTWTDSALQSRMLAQGYTSQEVSALMNKAYDSQGAWHARTAVALGLARWSSGMAGGLWEQQGLSPGNNNTWVSWDNELTWDVPYPYEGGSWREYFDYMKGSSSMTSANSAFKYRFGLKTFTNFLLEKKPGQANTPELAGCRTQPMQAVKDAGIELINIIENLDGDDRVSLVGYGTYGYGPSDKPNDLSWLTDDFDTLRQKIGNLQAGMWTTYTNIAQGIDDGSTVVRDYDHEARRNAAKVMILLTDGNANRTRSTAAYDESRAKTDTISAATDAAATGIQIYTVSVGSGADQGLMSDVADIGKGEWFHAEGSIAEYEAQLQAIFQNLGGKRPVMLVE